MIPSCPVDEFVRCLIRNRDRANGAETFLFPQVEKPGSSDSDSAPLSTSEPGSEVVLITRKFHVERPSNEGIPSEDEARVRAMLSARVSTSIDLWLSGYLAGLSLTARLFITKMRTSETTPTTIFRFGHLKPTTPETISPMLRGALRDTC